MRDKILIAIIAFLIAVCIATSSFAWGPFGMTGAAGGGTCNLGHTGTGTSPTTGSDNAAPATLFTAACSGTLGTAYAYHTSAQTDRTKICVYLDDGDNLANAGDNLVACSAVISSNANPGYGSAAFTSGSITSGNKYWLVSAMDTTTQFALFYNSSGYTGSTVTTGTDYYTSPPANLGTGTWTGNARGYAIYVTVTY